MSEEVSILGESIDMEERQKIRRQRILSLQALNQSIHQSKESDVHISKKSEVEESSISFLGNLKHQRFRLSKLFSKFSKVKSLIGFFVGCLKTIRDFFKK